MMDFENRLFHQFNGIVTIKHQITMELYKRIKGPLFNPQTARKSVEDVTDPFKNSINENCARVRAAFVNEFEDHIAHHYYIDGERGEAKTIPLPRDLVEWEE
jgi:hypothetical protein